MPAATEPSYYEYNPSTAAAIAFAAIYGVQTIITVWQIFHYRAWVWIVVLVACLMELLGYITRVVSTKNVTERGPYISNFVLIVLAPVIIAAGCYVVFGRIIWHVLPQDARTLRLLWVPPHWITTVFVGCDVFAFIVQAVGAVSVAGAHVNQKDQLQRGKDIVLVGLAIQIICFGYFCFVSIRAGFKLRHYYSLVEGNGNLRVKIKTIETVGSNKTYSRSWPTLLITINMASLLVMIRTIYRVVQFAMGKTGYIQRHEWFFYVFDTLPIFLCFILFNIFHPGRYLPNLGFRLRDTDIWANHQSRTAQTELAST